MPVRLGAGRLSVVPDHAILGDRGIRYTGLPSEQDRSLAMASIAPIWDGNETWLVFGGLGLLAAFPLAFALADIGLRRPTLHRVYVVFAPVAQVVLFAAPFVVQTFAASRAAKVEAQDIESGFLKSAGDAKNAGVMDSRAGRRAPSKPKALGAVVGWFERHAKPTATTGHDRLGFAGQ